MVNKDIENNTVKYIDIKSKIKTGDIIAFSTSKFKGLYSFFGFIVRLFTMSEYNHVGIAWVINGRCFLIEAQVPEVKITPLSKLGSFYHISLDKKVSQSDIDYLVDKVGEKYSILEAIKSYLKLNNPNDDQWICVEFIEYFLNRVNIKTNDLYTPSDVVSFLVKDLNKKLIYVKK